MTLDPGVTTGLRLLPEAERRQIAAELAAARRAQLVLYADLVAERYGYRPDVRRLEVRDPILAELEVQRDA